MALTVTTVDGTPIDNQTFTAGPVELRVKTNYEVTSLTAYVGEVSLPVTWTTRLDNRRWYTDATVDLKDVKYGDVNLDIQVITKGTTRQAYPIVVKAPYPWVETLETGPRIPESEMTTRAGGNLSVAGQVFKGVIFTSPVFIRAADITFEDCVVRTQTTSGKMIAVVKGGFVMDHCEVDGLGEAELGIGGSQFTVMNTNIHDLQDGFRTATNCLIDRVWVHHSKRPSYDPSAHNDSIQCTVGTGTIVRRSVLEAANPDTGDKGNAAFMIGGETGPTNNLLVEQNLLSGGNYTIQTGRGDIDLPTLTFRNNVYAGGWRYGPMKVGRGVVIENETYTDGTPIKVSYWN